MMYLFLVSISLSFNLVSGADDNNPIFHVPFDNSMTADKADGSREASAHGKITFQEGISGKAITIGVEENKKASWTEYNAKNNLDAQEGTISFWLKPLDWNGNDHRTQLFFEAKGKDSTMIIYKFINTDKLLFLFGPRPVNGNIRHSTAEFSIKNWKYNEWHFVACSWNRQNMKLYIDGELKDCKKIKDASLSPFDSFAVGAFAPENWEKSGGKTLVDEFTICKTAMPSEKIYADWQSRAPLFQKEGSARLITAGKVKSPPLVNGEIGPDEYTFKGTGFIDISRKSLSNWQSNYYLGYDDKNLYIAVVSPVLDLFRSQVKERDGKVYEDDSIEIFLEPRPSSGECFHFIINSTGALFDEKNHDPAWNIGDFSYVSKVNNRNWTVETAIPFERLGVKSPGNDERWRINICRSFPLHGIYTSISPVTAGYHNIGNFIFLKFLNSSSILNLDSIGNLSLGKLDFSLSMLNSGSEPEIVDIFIDLIVANKSLLACRKDFTSEPNVKLKIPLSKDGFKGKGSLGIEVISRKKGNLYSASFPFFTEDLLQLEYIYTLPEKQILKLRFKQLALTCRGKSYIVNINVFDKTGKKVLQKSFQKEEANYEVELSTSDLMPGNYNIQIFLQDPDGNIISSISKDYKIFPVNPAWEGNKIGITEKVPPPWIPIVASEESVKCWGREYSFKNSFLPSQICSQGKDLLASPISISVSAAGKELEKSDVKIEWKEKKGNKASIALSGKLGNIDLASDISIEYDGFMWVNLKLTPRTSIKIDRLTVNIPMKKEFATLVNSGDYKLKGTGALPENGWHKNLKKKPIFWIGNENVGLQWFAENLKGWSLKDADHSLEITPGKENVLVRINIIDSPIVLEGERLLSFGFMATPVKARPGGYRNWRPGRNLSIYYPWTKLYNYPEINFIEDGIKKELENYKAKKMQILFYHAIGGISPLIPEWEYFGENWMKNPPARGAWFDKGNRKWVLAFVCPNSQSYRDFYLWKLKQAISDMNMKHLYFDWGQVEFCTNSQHGCGWIDWNGELCPTYNILGTRILAQRIYSIMKEHNPDSIIANHTSGEIAMPVLAFSDVIVDGENQGEDVAREESYYKILPLDKFRSEYMPHNWGPVPILVPQFQRSAQIFNPKRLSFWSTKEAQKPMNHLRGLILIHDGICNQVTNNIWAIEDEFGWDDKVEFLPYWNNYEYIEILSPESKDVVVSAYKRPDKVMLIPFNNTDKDVILKLRLNIDRLGLGGKNDIRWTDKLNAEEFNTKDSLLEVPMDGRAFRMLVFGK